VIRTKGTEYVQVVQFPETIRNQAILVIAACSAIRTDYNKRAEEREEDFRLRSIDKKAYDKLGDLRQNGEDAYKRCFTKRASQQSSFAEARRQAQALLAAAMGK
jgi:hypothetical protein